MRKEINFFKQSLIILFFCLQGCASIQSPPGGPKDSTPPQVVINKSTPNFQTQFQKQPIELYFDEWITPGDAFSQIVISPPPAYPIDVKPKGKSVKLEFDAEEVLRENATYTINFGDYVKDYREGNIADDLRFVFSTGDFIDSLSLNGIVVDALTAEPVSDVLVMAYDVYTDSVVSKEKPFYFSKTNQSGRFSIQNMRAGNFKIFGLIDQNLNYLFDLPDEQIAFLDTLVEVNEVSSPIVSMTLFQEAAYLQVLETDASRAGLLKCTFTRQNVEPRFISLNGFTSAQTEIDQDTLKIWYTPESDTSKLEFLLFQDTTLIDTVRVNLLKEKPLRDSVLRSLEIDSKPLRPKDSLMLLFDAPISSIDTSLVKLYLADDTLETAIGVNLVLDSTNMRKTLLGYRWEEGKSYKLNLLPGAVQDIFNESNDSLLISFKVAKQEDFGDIILVFGQLPEVPSFIVEILNGDELIRKKIFQPSDLSSIRFKALRPGTYSLRMIADENQNGQWDTGNYYDKIQPEKILLKKLESLRANWEVEVQVDW